MFSFTFNIKQRVWVLCQPTYSWYRFGGSAGLLGAGFLLWFLRDPGLTMNIHINVLNNMCWQHLKHIWGIVSYLSVPIFYSFVPLFPLFVSLSLFFPIFISVSSFILFSFSVWIPFSRLISIPLSVFDSSFVSLLASALVFAVVLFTAVGFVRAFPVSVLLFLPFSTSTLLLFGLIWVLLVSAPAAFCDLSFLLE